MREIRRTWVDQWRRMRMILSAIVAVNRLLTAAQAQLAAKVTRISLLGTVAADRPIREAREHDPRQGAKSRTWPRGDKPSDAPYKPSLGRRHQDCALRAFAPTIPRGSARQRCLAPGR